jgi:hypothetical protein
MPRKRGSPMAVLPFRLPKELVKRLDRHAARLNARTPGLRITRSDALRSLLTAALDREEGGDHGNP